MGEVVQLLADGDPVGRWCGEVRDHLGSASYRLAVASIAAVASAGVGYRM